MVLFCPAEPFQFRPSPWPAICVTTTGPSGWSPLAHSLSPGSLHSASQIASKQGCGHFCCISNFSIYLKSSIFGLPAILAFLSHDMLLNPLALVRFTPLLMVSTAPITPNYVQDFLIFVTWIMFCPLPGMLPLCSALLIKSHPLLGTNPFSPWSSSGSSPHSHHSDLWTALMLLRIAVWQLITHRFVTFLVQPWALMYLLYICSLALHLGLTSSSSLRAPSTPVAFLFLFSSVPCSLVIAVLWVFLEYQGLSFLRRTLHFFYDSGLRGLKADGNCCGTCSDW